MYQSNRNKKENGFISLAWSKFIISGELYNLSSLCYALPSDLCFISEIRSVFLMFFLYDNMDRISISFIPPLSDGFEHTDNIADGTILILNSHIFNAPVIFDSIKSCIHFHATFSEFLPDIPRENHIDSSAFHVFVYYSVIFISFY